MQFEFMKGKELGTTDAIFIVWQLQKNIRTKGKKFYFGFVDLEQLLIRDVNWTGRMLWIIADGGIW